MLWPELWSSVAFDAFDVSLHCQLGSNRGWVVDLYDGWICCIARRSAIVVGLLLGGFFGL